MSRGTVALEFCWRMRSYSRTEVLTIFVEKITTCGRLHTADGIYWGEFLQQVNKNFSSLSFATEPGVVEETIRIKERSGNVNNLEP